MPIHPTAWIHDSAVVVGSVTLGERVSVWPAAVVRRDAVRVGIGDDGIVQDGAAVRCERGIPCVIGRRVTVGHRAGELPRSR